MYGKGAMTGAAVTTSGVAVATLPNTGGDMIVTVAISIICGLITWGVLYAKATN